MAADAIDATAETLSTADFGRLLIEIVRELDTALVEADQPAASSHYALQYRLERVAETLDSTVAPSRQQMLELYVASLATGLAAWAKGPPNQSSAQTIPAGVLARTHTRLETWERLRRPPEAVVDFESLLDVVLQSEPIRRDAAAVRFRLDALREVLREHRSDIFGSATAGLEALARARTTLATFLARRLHRTDSSVIEPPAESRRTSSDRSSASVPVLAVTNDQDRLEADLLEAAAAADQEVSGAIERAARRVLSEHAVDLKRTRLQLATTEGLAQVIDERLEISTSAAEGLAWLLRRMKGGSVGIAGPRGSGKSTIIRRFCDGREKIGDQPLLSVLVPAPVGYDSRDFMLHLFAEVCRSAGARPPPAEPVENAEGPTSRWPFGVAAVLARSAVAWLPLLAFWLIAGGIAGTVLASFDKVNEFVVWGGAVIVAGTGPLLLISVNRVSRRHWLGEEGSNQPRLVARVAFRLSAVMLPFGVLLLAAGVRGHSPSGSLGSAVAVTAAGLALAALVPDLGMLVGTRRPRASRDSPGNGEWPPRGDELIAAASLRLEELRYQQSFKTGLTGKVGLPLGLEVGASAERTLARHAMTFPEVVASFRQFLAFAATSHDVLIAVDELDKLEADDDSAKQFLNDLKAAFGVPNTYFLVSVSEDAMSRFERRGLPFRDVFDSTFDEIVRVAPLSLAEAQALLSERVVGLPYIYSGLCHVLAGGIPRDLIRMARRTVEVNERLGKPDTLGAIVGQLIKDELASKAYAVEYAAIALQSPDSSLDATLDWLREFRAAVSDRDELLRLIETLQDSARGLDEDRTSDGLAGLTLELGTYGYFMLTVLDFFQDRLSEDEVDAAANGAHPNPSLEGLALARMAFGVSATTAWLGINAFRTAARLVPAALPPAARRPADPGPPSS